MKNTSPVERLKTSNYENILFRDTFNQQLNPLEDASWILEFVRDNFPPCDVFPSEWLGEWAADNFYIPVEDVKQYVKDTSLPEDVFSETQLAQALKRIEKNRKGE